MNVVVINAVITVNVCANVRIVTQILVKTLDSCSDKVTKYIHILCFVKYTVI